MCNINGEVFHATYGTLSPKNMIPAASYYSELRISDVPGAGLEPARPSGQRILSPLRLPIPPSRHRACELFYKVFVPV